MKAVLVLAVIGVCIALQTQQSTTEQFVNFSKKFGKTYAAAEWESRLQKFEANLALIEKMNAEHVALGGGVVYGVNQFADLSPEEFANFYLMPHYERPSHAGAKELDIDFSATIPASFDWRNVTPPVVTPVKNQEQCGSCWAFSTTEEIESQWAIAGNTLVELSVQQIVDCDTVDEGCNGGDTVTAYAYVEKAGGLELESEYPYTAEDGKCTFKSSDVVASISGFAYATQDKNETAMQYALAAKGPLSICVDAASWQFYIGGVIEHLCGQSLDHCVMITGYGSEKDLFGHQTPVWYIRNSWGATWGEAGYIWVERGKNLCGVADEATIAVI